MCIILTNIKGSLFSYSDVLCDSYDAKNKQQSSLHILNWLVFMFRIVWSVRWKYLIALQMQFFKLIVPFTDF